jgi:hypothetical protein
MCRERSILEIFASGPDFFDLSGKMPRMAMVHQDLKNDGCPP